MERWKVHWDCYFPLRAGQVSLEVTKRLCRKMEWAGRGGNEVKDPLIELRERFVKSFRPTLITAISVLSLCSQVPKREGEITSILPFHRSLDFCGIS